MSDDKMIEDLKRRIKQDPDNMDLKFYMRIAVHEQDRGMCVRRSQKHDR